MDLNNNQFCDLREGTASVICVSDLRQVYIKLKERVLITTNDFIIEYCTEDNYDGYVLDCLYSKITLMSNDFQTLSAILT